MYTFTSSSRLIGLARSKRRLQWRKKVISRSLEQLQLKLFVRGGELKKAVATALRINREDSFWTWNKSVRCILILALFSLLLSSIAFVSPTQVLLYRMFAVLNFTKINVPLPCLSEEEEAIQRAEGVLYELHVAAWIPWKLSVLGRRVKVAASTDIRYVVCAFPLESIFFVSALALKTLKWMARVCYSGAKASLPSWISKAHVLGRKSRRRWLR